MQLKWKQQSQEDTVFIDTLYTVLLGLYMDIIASETIMSWSVTESVTVYAGGFEASDTDPVAAEITGEGLA